MPGVLCPHCVVLVDARPEIGRGPVYRKASRQEAVVARVVGGYETPVKVEGVTYPLDVDDDIFGHGYMITLCPNCEQRFVVESKEGSYRAVWPVSTVRAQREVAKPVAEALVDAKKSHAIGAELASLLAARTALVRLQRDENVSSLRELVAAGKLSEVLYRQADEVRLWANVEGHEDVPPGAVRAADVDELLEYLDTVIRVIYVDPARLKKRQERRKNLKE